ncbi:MAG: cache domain-containing protein [Candidatus Cloacimonetes bacterium]|nr:cache domain-containing protein [Candidatus Cloacimonadota bacterium]
MKITLRSLSFTTKMLLLILIILMCTTISFMLFTQYEVEKIMWNTVTASVHDMRRLISLYVENEYRGLLFHKEYALNRYKEQLKNVTGLVISDIDYYHSLYEKGVLSEQDAKAFALESVENFRYGNNDYFYIYNTDLVAISHPDPLIKDSDMTEYQDVKGNYPLKMIRDNVYKTGSCFESFWYIRLNESKPVEKLTYNYYFKPWNWIIGTGVYIDDIDKDIESKLEEILSEFRKTFSKIRIGENGYFFIFNNNHIILVHPTMEGVDFADIHESGMGIEHWEHLVEASKNPDTPYIYLWDKPGYEENYKFKKIAYVDFFEPLNWYIVSSFYIDEMKEPSRRIFHRELFITLAALLLGFTVTFFIVRRFTKPVKILTSHARQLTENNFGITDSTELSRLTKFSHDEMGHLAETFISMERTLQQYITDLKLTTAANEKIRSELRIAHEIQMSMLSRTFPAFPERDEIDIYALLEPAKEVGGDLYDFFFIDNDHLCFLIGDVSDKGVPAALFMARSKSLIRATSMLLKKGQTGIPSPAEIISEVNLELYRDNEHCMFLTLLLGILNVTTGHISLTNAGHNTPYLLKENQIELIELPHKTPLGLRENIQYTSEELMLSDRQSIFLYTDGITEAINKKDELFGEKKLEKTLRIQSDSSPNVVLKMIIKEVHKFADGTPQSDDITMLAIQYFSNKREE